MARKQVETGRAALPVAARLYSARQHARAAMREIMALDPALAWDEQIEDDLAAMYAAEDFEAPHRANLS